MPATSAASVSFASTARRPGVLDRSTASVRTRYRRQTAALLVGTTVVGVWLGLAAPSVSPVTPTTTSAVGSDLADAGARAGLDRSTGGHQVRSIDNRHGGQR